MNIFYLNSRLLSKLACVNEVQGADGAEKLSVQKLLDASGANISLPSLRDVVETDEARRTKDFGDELYASYRPSRNPSSTQHSSSFPQVVVDGNKTIRSNPSATQQFEAEVECQIVGGSWDRLRRAEWEQPEGRAEWGRASQFRKKFSTFIRFLLKFYCCCRLFRNIRGELLWNVLCIVEFFSQRFLRFINTKNNQNSPVLTFKIS